jgi:uncharacterized protein YhfF
MMTEQMHSSVPAMWFSFIAENIEHSHTAMPDSWHFGITKKDADTCTMLVKAGIKTASSVALASYLHYESPIPAEGDFSIITNWEGEAQCIIQTTAVEIVPFNEVTEDYAVKEGEGDQSLTYWKEVHWEFFTKDLKSFGEPISEDLMVVCEEFELVFVLS